MNFKHLFKVVLILFLTSCSSSRNDKRWRTGKFVLTDMNNNVTCIIRNDSIQNEFNDKNYEATLKLDWESDSVYYLTLLKTSVKLKDYHEYLKAPKAIKIRIDSTLNNTAYYTQFLISPNKEIERFSGTMVKVENLPCKE